MAVIVRPAGPADDPGVASVARRNGQPPRQSGADPAYTDHLRAHGRLLVAVERDVVMGYGATAGIGGASMLTDLFVDPDRHGMGAGRALLAALWPAGARGGDRFTFASQDPRALSVYLRAGLAPWWPLLYLRGTPGALRRPALDAARVTPAAAARVERRLTGLDREPDLALLSAGEAAGGLVVTNDGQPVAAGSAVPGSLSHLACPDPSVAADAVIAGLRALGGTATVCLPGPHPAVPELLAAGYRVTDFDLHMATRRDLLAPAWAYSPSLA